MKKSIAGIFCFLAGILSVNLFAAPDAVASAPGGNAECERNYIRKDGQCVPDCVTARYGDTRECVRTEEECMAKNKPGKRGSYEWTGEFCVTGAAQPPDTGKVTCPDGSTATAGNCPPPNVPTTAQNTGECNGDLVLITLYAGTPEEDIYCGNRPATLFGPGNAPDPYAPGGEFCEQTGNPNCTPDEVSITTSPVSVSVSADPGPAPVEPPDECPEDFVMEVSGDCRPRVLSDCEPGQILDAGECREPENDAEPIPVLPQNDDECELADIYQPVYDPAEEDNCRARNRCEWFGHRDSGKHTCATTPEDCAKYANTEWDESEEGDYKCVSMHYEPDGQYRECPEGQYWWYSGGAHALTYCAICENEFVCAHTKEECDAVGGDWRGNARTDDHSLMCWRDKNARASIAVPPAPPFTIPEGLLSGPAFTPPVPTCSSSEVIDEESGECRPRVLSDCGDNYELDPATNQCECPTSYFYYNSNSRRCQSKEEVCINGFFTALEWNEIHGYEFCPNALPANDHECFHKHWEQGEFVYDETAEGNCRLVTDDDCGEHSSVQERDGRWACYLTPCPFGERLNRDFECVPCKDEKGNIHKGGFCKEYRISLGPDLCPDDYDNVDGKCVPKPQPEPDPPTFEEECEASGGEVVDSDATTNGKACFYPATGNRLTRTPEDVQSGPEAVQNAAAQLGIAQASYAPVQQISPSAESRLPEYAAPAALIGALAFSSLYPDYELNSSFNYSGENGSLDWEAGMRGDFHHGSFRSYVSAIQDNDEFTIHSGTTYRSDSFLASYTTIEAKDYMNYAVQLSAPWKYSGWNISPNLSSQFHYDRDENHSSSESGAGLDLEYWF